MKNRKKEITASILGGFLITALVTIVTAKIHMTDLTIFRIFAGTLMWLIYSFAFWLLFLHGSERKVTIFRLFISFLIGACIMSIITLNAIFLDYPIQKENMPMLVLWWVIFSGLTFHKLFKSDSAENVK